MKAKNINLNWLPRAEEWDFRLVAPEECRVACHWEYARHELPPMSKPGDQYVFCPHNYRQAAREHFPAPWLSLTKAQREKILESFYPAPVMQVRTLREFFKRMPTNGSHPEILQALLRHSYVIIPNFRVHGVEAVIKEFEKWARKEAKQHPQSRRAQAAEPPFDALKWLAVARLDKARSKAKVTIEQARESLAAYRRAHSIEALNDAYPAYASDGAWIKAVKNAAACQKKSAADPRHLLADLA